MKNPLFKFAAILGALLCSTVALAADVTITWASTTDPAVGWNVYYNHLQTPDALQYIGTAGASQRAAVLHNISLTGVYQFGISRVDYVDDHGTNRRIESTVEVVTIVDGQWVATPTSPGIYDVAIDP